MARVVVVGMGAMGSVYAALLQDAGHEVHGVCLWPDHVEAVARDGLRVYGASGDRRVRLASIGTQVPTLVADLLIIATKSYDVTAAAESSQRAMGPDTVVQSIQNGLGSAEHVAAILGGKRVVIGVVGGFGASLREPGVVHHHGMEVVRFGPYDDIPPEDLRWSAEVWRSAGFDATVFTDPADVGRMVWEKLVMNVAFSAVTCLTGMTIGQVMSHPDAWSLARACVLEAVAVASACGITLDVGDPVAHVQSLGGAIPGARPSMLLDAQAHRRGEIDAINGAVAQRGAARGVPVPVNEVLSRAVRAMESTYLPSPETSQQPLAP